MGLRKYDGNVRWIDTLGYNVLDINRIPNLILPNDPEQSEPGFFSTDVRKSIAMEKSLA